MTMNVTMSLLETSNDQRAVATDGLVMLGLFAGGVETADEGSCATIYQGTEQAGLGSAGTCGTLRRLDDLRIRFGIS